MTLHRREHEDQIQKGDKANIDKNNESDRLIQEYLPSFTTYNDSHRQQNEQANRKLTNDGSLPECKIVDQLVSKTGSKLDNVPKHEQKQNLPDDLKTGKPVREIQSRPSEIESRAQKHDNQTSVPTKSPFELTSTPNK